VRLAYDAAPAPTRGEKLDTLRAAHDDLVAYGFAEVHEMMAQPELPSLVRELEERGEWTLATRLFATPDAFPELVRHFGAADPSSRLRMGGLKLFLDGALNARTAHMLEPYDDPIPAYPCGASLIPPDELARHLAFCHAGHIDCAIHAIGDAAVRTALDAYEAMDDPTFTLRIEHAQFVHEADVPRFARMGVVASVQPCHLLTDIEPTLRLLPTRAHRAFPVRDLVESARAAGRDPAELVLFGSDTPVVSPDPADNIRGAVHRRRPDSEALAPDQAITLEESLELMAATS